MAAPARISVAAARRISTPYVEGVALNSLGAALAGARRFKEAIEADQEAIRIFQALGERSSEEAQALNNLGIALRQLRRLAEAADAHQRAARIYAETGDRGGQGAALGNLGLVLRRQHRFAEGRALSQSMRFGNGAQLAYLSG